MAAISKYFPAEDQCFSYFDPCQPATFITALDQFEAFITCEAPYYAVLAYSRGAQLVAPMLTRLCARDPSAKPFKCAFFLSGGIPYDFRVSLQAPHLIHVDTARDGDLIHIPTANIWGAHARLHPGISPVLSALCRLYLRTVFVHSGGHDIPRSKDRQDLMGCVKAVRRTIDVPLVG